MASKKLPQKLYKYRSFDARLLGLLSNGEVFYADPRWFNDPLDCEPTIQIDADRTSLENLCFKMLLSAGKSKLEARAVLRNCRYMSTEPDGQMGDTEVAMFYKQLLRDEIRGLLKAEMGSMGVLSLSERWDCPLMWSHYADKHQGMCIEFDLTIHQCTQMKPVDYKGPRSIKITDLIQWKLHGSVEAKDRILDTYFFTKSPRWRYEREWRDIGPPNGVRHAPFRVSAVYFGVRCDGAVRDCIVRLFSNNIPAVAFYDICLVERNFRLKRRHTNTDEIVARAVPTPAFIEFHSLCIDKSIEGAPQRTPPRSQRVTI